MWSVGNIWIQGVSQNTTLMSTPPSSYLMVMPEIHVLLVDHDSESLLSTSQLLQLCQYRVTLVEVASSAIQMLFAGKIKIDIIMVNVNSPDLQILKLLQHAANMDIPVIVMSDEEDAFMAMSALQSGALLFLKKPIAMDMLKCIWQFIAWRKIRAATEREKIIAANCSARGIEFKETTNPIEDNMLMMNKDYNKQNDDVGGEYYDSENCNGINKRKACTEWTPELHQKFMDVVEKLGEGRCFPKEIHELMNVPGLTRMQVSSHLQKCRNHNWRSLGEREPSTDDIQHPPSEPSDAVPRKLRRFGLMPKSDKCDRSKSTMNAFVDDSLNLSDLDFLVHNLSAGMMNFADSSVNIPTSSQAVANSNDGGGNHIEETNQINTVEPSTQNRRQTSLETRNDDSNANNDH